MIRSKRFVGWVTNLHNKYWRDVFFRTEVNVIFLQILFATTLAVIVSISFNYLYRDILQTLIAGITENIKNNGSINGQTILDSMEVLKAKNFVSFFVTTIVITLIYSFIIAKVTLTPARNALKSQKRFISDIAHELRTPLSVLKTNSEVALLDESSKAISRELLESNIEELDRASAIINNLLSFSNLIRPEQVKFDNVDLAKVVENTIKKVEMLADGKKITLSHDKFGSNNVLGNAVALEQICINLVRNAINFTPNGGHINIVTEQDYYENVILSVEDNGIGIAPKDLNHIFEPFYRAEISRNKKSGGSGLGLAIVSELVKLHKGEITVRSRVNQGTTVEVTFPHKKIK